MFNRLAVSLLGYASKSQGISSFKRINIRKCSSSPFTACSVNDQTGIAVLNLKRPPVNSLNLELLTELNITLDKLHSNKNIRGLIFTSDLPKIFSAGLDIREMYQPKRERLTEFWRTFQNFFVKLYDSRLFTIAAIAGNAPAGGCMIALCCDYRIMVRENYRIGLNEVHLGIVAPFWLRDVMETVIGRRKSEHALINGSLFSVDEAYRLGLIDQVVDDGKHLEAAHKQLNEIFKIPDVARVLTKSSMRRKQMQIMETRRDEELAATVDYLMKDSIQKCLGDYLQSLKDKKKPSS